ncbi:MAG: MFS transporter [Anaerolineae bacterium]
MPADKRSLQIAAFTGGISLFWVSLYLYVPVLAVHARDLGANDTVVGLVVGSYGLTQLLLRIPLGIVSDRMGARKAFIIAGFVCSAISGLLLAVARDPMHMLVGRALSGVAASSWVASTVMFSSFYPPNAAVRATSIMSFSSSLGQMVATFAGGLLAFRLSAVAPFWTAGGVALLGMLALLTIPEERRQGGATPSLRQILSVLTTPSLLLVSLAAATVQYATFATSYAFTPIYASEVLGLDSAQLGVLTSIVLVPYVLITTVVARLATRVREQWLLTLGLSLLAISTAATPMVHSYGPLLAMRALFGAGMGLTYPVLMGLSIKAVPQARRASAMGAFQAIYALGMTAGPALSGFIADQVTLTAVFPVTAIMCLIGLLPVWLSVAAIRKEQTSPALL